MHPFTFKMINDDLVIMDPPHRLHHHQRRRPSRDDGNFSFRTASRMIAYVNIALTFVEIFGLIFFFIIVYFISNGQTLKELLPVHAIMYAVSYFVAIHLVLAILDLWLSFGLLSATDPGVPVEGALSKASHWRTFKAVLLAVEGIVSGVGGIFGSCSTLWFAVRVAAVVTVHLYAQELEEAAVQHEIN